MKIFVSADVDALRNAGEWFSNPRLQPVLRDLEERLSRRESKWGECIVFVEVAAPHREASKSRQIDLLICYSDRAALCEIKQGLSQGSIHFNSQAAARQLGKQLDPARALLERSGLDPKCIFAFLWAPHVSRADLDDVVLDKGLLTLHHISISGASPDFKNLQLADQNYAYFPQSVIDRLSRSANIQRPEKEVSDVFLSAIRRAHRTFEIPLLEFTNFSRLHEYLSERSEDPILVFDPDYVPGIRSEALDKGMACLNKTRFVEVLGPAGIGKTSFIRELLKNHSENESYAVLPPVVLQRKADVLAILRVLAEQSGAYDPEQLGVVNQAGLLKLLARNDFVYWIRDYDAASEPAVRRLCKLLDEAAQSGKAYWVVESMVSDYSVTAPYQVSLAPFDNRTMSKILERHRRGASSSDIATVIDLAQGIPRLAIWHWSIEHSDEEGAPPSERLDQYQLFLRHLPLAQRPYVTAIAYILAEAPLGCTIKLVESWCRAIDPFPKGKLSAITCGVLEQARIHRLIAIETFGGVEHDDPINPQHSGWSAQALCERLLPGSLDEARMGSIHVIDPHFVEHFVRAIAPETLKQWRSKLGEVFLNETREDLSLTGVTFSLMVDDFRPFLRSGFRTSSAMLPRLKAWLTERDSKIGQSTTLDDAYFRRWLNWTIDHYWDVPRSTSASSIWELPPPETDSPLQQIAFDTARTRGEWYRKDGVFDWSAWASVADQLLEKGELDLWAEAVLRRAQALLRAPNDDPRLAWALMKSVMAAEEKLSSAGRGMMYFHLLSFLNKRKLVLKHLPDIIDETRELIPELANKMVEAGFATENVNSIANAIFFLVRAIESENRAVAPADVENYSALMRFVQRVSPARKVQALLTEGTIYRHCCSGSNIQWDDFCSHAEEALAIYDRAIDAARRAGMSTHVANGLSYSGLICLKALRYSSEPTFTVRLNEIFSGRWVRLENAFRDGRLVHELQRGGGLDRGILINLYKNLTIQLWLCAVLLDRGSVDALPATFRLAASELKSHSASLSSGNRIKEYQIFVVDLTRVLQATRNASKYKETVQICSNVFLEVLNDASALMPADPAKRARTELFKRARRLSELLS
jgi:RecA/RadA recombinase